MKNQFPPATAPSHSVIALTMMTLLIFIPACGGVSPIKFNLQVINQCNETAKIKKVKLKIQLYANKQKDNIDSVTVIGDNGVFKINYEGNYTEHAQSPYEWALISVTDSSGKEICGTLSCAANTCKPFPNGLSRRYKPGQEKIVITDTCKCK